MSDRTVQTAIEILGKSYSIRCPESEIKSLQQAAQYLNQKMLEVQESGKAINLERIAIIAALNIAYQYLQLDQRNNNVLSKINQHITTLQDKLDTAISNAMQRELIYAAEEELL